MASFSRKMRRKAAKKATKDVKKNLEAAIEETIKAKMETYNKIPESCTSCDKTMDKTDRSQVFSWMMRIYEEEEIYDLYCPECYTEQFPVEKEKGEMTNE